MWQTILNVANETCYQKVKAYTFVLETHLNRHLYRDGGESGEGGHIYGRVPLNMRSIKFRYLTAIAFFPRPLAAGSQMTLPFPRK